MSEMICHDRGDHDLMTDHGAWWLTAWCPLPRRRAFYVGASNSRRWVHWRPFPWLRVAVVRRGVGGRLPSLSVHRWCAHINVTHHPAREPESDGREGGAA